MKIIKALFAATIIAIFSQNTFASSYESALMNAKNKNWAEALKHAESATEEVPNEYRNWMLLGIINERLENNSKTLRAYEKFLDLNPPEQKAKSIREKVVGLKQKVDDYLKRKYTAESGRFFIGYSPIWKSKLAEELGSNLSTTFDAGFQYAGFFIVAKYGSSTLNGLIVAPKGSETSKTIAKTYTVSSGAGIHTLWEFFIGGQVPLVDPYKSWGQFQLTLPIYLGGAQNTVKLNSRTYGSIGYDMAAGLQLSYYTKTALTFDVSALYHYGLPFWGVREDSTSPVVRGLKSTDASSGMTGLEIRAGLSFLFGNDVPENL